MRTKFLAYPMILLATIGMAGWLIGQDESEGGSDEVGFKSIKTEFDEAYKEFMKAYRAEEDSDKKSELVENMPKKDDFAEQVFNIAASPESEEAAEALAWLIGGGGDADIREKAIAMMLEDHIDSEHIAKMAPSLGRSGPSQQAEATFRAIIEKSPSKDVRGKTSFALVQYFQRLERFVGNEKLINRMGDESTKEYLTSKTKESVDQDLDSLIESIKEDYADVVVRGGKTLGERIGPVVFERERLQIGMIVPEVEGEDLDGKSFKLSDYRGKVVVIDFWGDW